MAAKALLNVGVHLGSVSVSWWRPLQLECGVGVQWSHCLDFLEQVAASMHTVQDRSLCKFHVCTDARQYQEVSKVGRVVEGQAQAKEYMIVPAKAAAECGEALIIIQADIDQCS